ncbi:hypothetical protein RB620_05540 [Paenibacillus sp. LHD-117]|uniref:hypothetical protein n=1 Tax=Paenibacillus sp. LHD-117 TaxID=3071412 RepID=UPI0027E06EBB|nr:hypothetical protein [Paenibacillus sp. LHD-117]MDQ6418900.1 hypothetical protein [Paenibacillus sp. LHD-117]
MKNKLMVWVGLFVILVLVGVVISTTISADQFSEDSSPQTSEVKTELNRTWLQKQGMTLDIPAVQAGISEDEAIRLASAYCDVIAPKASKVSAEYHLMTYQNWGEFSEAALSKNDQLRKDGYLNKTPIYIVNYKGIKVPSLGGQIRGGKAEKVIFTEKNVVLDAKSGEILFTFSYK